MRVLAILLCLASSLAWAQTYPERAIRLVVPWPAGGATDAAGRVMAQRLSERLSTPVVVENKAGAAGTIGAAQVARAPADGYTLLVASAETHAIARADFPAGTTKELVAVVKGQPGKFSYSSAGLGSTSQIAMETFKALAGLDILHVPFQGQAPAITSLLGGQTDLQMLPAGSAAPLRKGGKLKAFAVSTRSRFFDLPDVPTLAEEGFEMNFANWFGLVAPAGSPAAAVQRLAAESTAALKSADTQAALKKIGLDVFPAMSPAEFEKFLEAEMTRWGGVIRGAGIKAE